jgi:hypothetical protein
MYTRQSLESIARTHGWKGEEQFLPLHLPFGILRTMGTTHPYTVAVGKAAKKMRVEGSVFQWLMLFENDRALSDVLTERIYVSPPQEQEQQEQQPELKQSEMYIEGEGEGEPQDDNQEQQEQQDNKQQGEGKGDQSEGDKQDKQEPSKQPEVSKPSPPVQQKPKPQPQQRAGQTPNQQQKALNQWLKSMKGEQQKKQKQQATKFTTNSEHGGVNEVSAGDLKIANRLRSYWEQISGAFDQEITPRWDASKLVKRTLGHQPLDPARKWEDGRPNMALWTDTSGSCQAMSATMTRAFNSACMLGTPQGNIYSFPFSNNWFEYDSAPGYHNGKPLQSIGYEYEDERMVKAGTARTALMKELANAKFDKHVDVMVRMSGVAKQDAEAMLRIVSGQNRVAIQNMALMAHEVGVKLTPNMPVQISITGTVTPMLEAIARNRFDLCSIGVMAAMNCEYYIYYTDHDGMDAIVPFASLLKPHQHLYVLTYATIPNMKVSNTSDLPHQVRVHLKGTGGWVSRARNELGFHVANGSYSSPATVSNRNMLGISVPSYAYTPQHRDDRQWLPKWFNYHHWHELMGKKGMTQVTVIPNVDSMDGALDALRLIASPDRMAMAIQGGRKVRADMEREGRWGVGFGHSGMPVSQHLANLDGTEYDVS